MSGLLLCKTVLPVCKGVEEMSNVFEVLNKVNVNDHKEDKQNGCSYLSWTWAWAEVKKAYPTASYTIKRFDNNLPYVYDEKTGYMVFTEVTIDGMTHEMWLPVMDNMNKAMKAEPYMYKTKTGKEMWVKQADMFDINKTLMRCLVKNLAIFGLGLYIYAGEDLPEFEEESKEEPKEEKKTRRTSKKKEEPKETPKEEKPKVASEQQIAVIQSLIQKVHKDEAKICEVYKVKRIQDLNVSEAAEVYRVLRKYEAEL